VAEVEVSLMAAKKQRSITEKGQGQDVPFKGMPLVTYLLQLGSIFHSSTTS
jgi:hypothetical protein